jgi:hypothetical protein
MAGDGGEGGGGLEGAGSYTTPFQIKPGRSVSCNVCNKHNSLCDDLSQHGILVERGRKEINMTPTLLKFQK